MNFSARFSLEQFLRKGKLSGGPGKKKKEKAIK